MEMIAIQFPARRYHATPWDAHVNEGRIEWPPSPWRLIRSFLAVGYNKLGWSDSPSDSAAKLLIKLSSILPSYSLPKATECHTRHYMPTSDKTAKVFDAFLRFPNPEAELLVRFDVVLEQDERQTLADLVEGLAYLGRAESWAEARLLLQDEATKMDATVAWCLPNATGDGRPVRLLSALPIDEFDTWRSNEIKDAADALEIAERRKVEANGKTLSPAVAKKVRLKAEANYPRDLISAMQLETAIWQSQGWPQPPGSRWVSYRLADTLLEERPLATRSISKRTERFQAVLLAVDGEGKKGTVRPLMKRALPLMELLHSESIRKATREFEFGNLPDLSGKDNDGSILRGHQHASWLPLSLYGQERIDHVLVVCRSGFSPQAITTLSSIRWAYSKDIDHLAINVAGMGTVEDIVNQLSQVSKCREIGLQPLRESCLWVSRTPLVFRKFVHTHGKKSPEGQIREELEQRGFDSPVRVRIWTSNELVESNLKGYVLTRKPGKQQPPYRASWGATIEFPKPQQGPISLGYASHFGLGSFQSDER
jgi:CRISPR-associated protein Csb2